jgi:DNA-binding transcriptional ArsR family regulator
VAEVRDASRNLDLVFGALADPNRRAMLTRLSRGPATAGELAEPLRISRPAVSQHLNVLESAGLVVRTRRAQWRTCTLRVEPLDEVSAWLGRQRAAWEESFDALEDRLRELKRERENGPGHPGGQREEGRPEEWDGHGGRGEPAGRAGAPREPGGPPAGRGTPGHQDEGTAER